MPGPNVGYAQIQVDWDGTRLGPEMRKVATKAGIGSGLGFTDGFSKGLTSFTRDLTKKLEKDGKLSGKKFTEQVGNVLKSELSRYSNLIVRAFSTERGFQAFAKEVGGADNAVRELNSALDRLAKSGELSKRTFDRSRVQLQKWADAVRDSEEAEKAAAAARKAAADQLERDRAAIRATRAENERLSKVLRDVNLVLGSQSNWNTLVKESGNAGKAVRELRSQMDELVKAGKISDNQYRLFSSRIKTFSTEAVKSVTAVRQQSEEIDRSSKVVDKLGQSWRRMDSTVRLVIGLIVAGASDVATLGSAAGAGILTLGAALSELVGPAIAIGATFKTLSGDIDALPASAQAVAREFRALKTSFGEAREVIAAGAFSQLEGVFGGLTNSVRDLSPELSNLGVNTGRALRSFATLFGRGQPGFKELRTLIDNSADSFGDLTDAVGDLTVGLLRGFNRAQPLVEDLYGWVGRLAEQFEEFTRSEGFDEWVDRARRVFGSLGNLLDVTGRALNDLVDEGATRRLTDLLDNLSRAIPPLSRALDVVSVLDPLGLLVKVLADLLVAVDPLLTPLSKLAETISLLVSAGVDVVAPAITGLATAVGNLLTLVDPTALLAVIAAIVTLKNIGPITSALKTATTAIGVFGLTVAELPKKLGGVKGAAKSLGKGLGLAALFNGLTNAMSETNEASELTVSRLGEIHSAFVRTGSADALTDQLDLIAAEAGAGSSTISELQYTLESLYSSDFSKSGNFGQGIANAIDGITFGITDLGANFRDNKATIEAWGSELANLSSSDLPAAQSSFAKLAIAAGGGDEAIGNLLKGMPAYEQSLRGVGDAAGYTLTEQELFNLAVGITPPALRRAQEAAAENAKRLADLAGGAADASGEISDLADQIRNFGSAQLDTREAARDFQEAIQDLTDSVADNGASLEINTEAGRNNEAALDDIAKAALDYSAATLEQTGSQEQANAVIEQGREALIKALEQFGITGDAANQYADDLGLIPGNIDTAAAFYEDQKATQYDTLVRNIPTETFTTAVFRTSGYEDLIDIQDRLREITGDHSVHVSFGAGGAGGLVPGAASGRILTKSTVLRAGEAGPEAIVPLRRNLSQVDPSVRGLSAIAQGFAGGGIAGVNPGRTVVVEEGAIQITTVTANPTLVASAVLDRIVANLPV